MPKNFAVVMQGDDKLRARLQRLGALGPAILAMVVHEQAEALMAEIDERHVPVDQGGLRKDAWVKPPVVTPNKVAVAFGFGGTAIKYAESVHENPRAGKTGGLSPSGRAYKHWAKVGHWHFVSEPLNRLRPRLNRLLGARIQREWGKLFG